MRKTAFITLSFAALSLLLAACANEPNTAPFRINYGNLGKITLNVGSIYVVDRSGGPLLQPPYVDAQFRPSVIEAIHRWEADRLQSGGNSGQADFIIKEGNVVQETLPVKSGMSEWFTREQGIKYTAHAAVEIDAKGPTAYGLASAEATRSITVMEDPSDEEKQKAWHTLLDGLMADLNQNLEQSIRAHLQSFIVAAPQNP